ncbi:c-type cytochrome [Seohaeicola nanhaiensis]|uniref:C-type cytochrome n=1 Tax=Seohaeicola nanhaiensis TaxID=1387282 RepID=A0ABV9KNM6_9RHOB
MTTKMTVIAALALAALAGTAAIGDSHVDKAALAAVKARQATMNLYAFNLGQLGAMAKGEVEYNADAASAAAGNLAKLTSMNQMAAWLPGTDNATLGDDVTHALPAIWESGSTVGEKAGALREAATALEAAAGGGLESLRGAMGPVGKSCGACHELYRAKSN